MVKLSIRDLWGKHTQKKELNPQMRTMLMGLDGVYEPRKPVDPSGDDEQRSGESAGEANQ